MTLFADYARYYNALYNDKDYAAEAAFALDMLAGRGVRPKTLLDLGCGTGRHALEMAGQGVAVAGVDMSETMLEMGRAMLERLNPADFPAPLPELHHGDIRNARLGAAFDAAISLFHVMSYQTTEEDALAALATARAHLKPGGLFLFDFWYGPGVLADPPARREKSLADGRTKVVRKAIPVQRIRDNLVEVRYDVLLTDMENGKTTSLNECHLMRYWFLPELRYLAKTAGFSVLAEGEWLKRNFSAPCPWNAWMLARI